MPTYTTRQLLIALFDGIGEDVTPTADFTPVPGFPLENLGKTRLDAKCRTPTLDDATLQWDMGEPVDWNVFMLAGTNATRFAERRFSAADDAGMSVNVEESGPGLDPAVDTSLGHSRAVYVPSWGRLLVYVHPHHATSRYFQWEQSDPANPLGYHEWATARVGLGFQLSFESWRTVPRNGARPDQRAHEFTFPLATRQETYDLENIARTSLLYRRMLVIPEPDNPESWPNDALWCTLESMHPREVLVGTRRADRRFTFTMTFVEATR